MKTIFFIAIAFLIDLNTSGQAITKVICYQFDTSNCNTNRESNSNIDYYKDSIFRYKSYFSNSDRLYCEFIRIESTKFMYFEYDSTGNKTKASVAQLESTPFFSWEVAQYDSAGNVEKSTALPCYKFYKTEDWVEYINKTDYCNGSYHLNKREGVWGFILKNQIEKVVTYKFGIATDSVLINKKDASIEVKKRLIIKKWNLQLSFNSETSTRFTVNPTSYEKFDYLDIRQDGTVINSGRTGHHGWKKKSGTWEFMNNGKELKMMFPDGAFTAVIDYISETELTLSFKE